MSRIDGVDPQGRPLIGFIYRTARREIRKLTGRALLTPDIPVRAHRPGLLIGYAALEKAVATRPRVPASLRALAVLKSAVMQRESEHFDERERLVLDLAVAMTVTPVQVDLRSRFNAAFGLGAAGFSEGMACARMEPATAGAAA